MTRFQICCVVSALWLVAETTAPAQGRWVDRYNSILSSEPEAKNIAPMHEFWRHIYHFPSDAEKQLLRDIRKQGEADRKKILVEFLDAAGKSNQEYLPIEYVVHAAVGVDSKLRDNVLATILQTRLKQSLTNRERDACLRVGLALGAPEQLPGFGEMAMTRLLAVPRRPATTYAARINLGNHMQLIETVFRTTRREEKTPLLEMLTQHLNVATDREWGEQIQRVARQAVLQLSDEEFEKVAEKIATVHGLVSSYDVRQRLLQFMPTELVNQPRSAPKSEMEKISKAMWTKLEDPFLPAQTVYDAMRHVRMVAEFLTPDQRQMAAKRLLAIFEQTEKTRRPFLLRYLGAVAESMTLDQIQETIELAVADRTARQDDRDYPTELFEEFCERIPATHALATVRLLSEKRNQNKRLETEFLRLILKVCPRIPPADTKNVIREFARLLLQGDAHIAEAMIATAQSLDAEERVKVERFVLDKLKETTNLDDRAVLIASLGKSSLGTDLAKATLNIAYADLLKLAAAEPKFRGNEPYGTTRYLRPGFGQLISKISDDDRARVMPYLERQLREMSKPRPSWRTDLLGSAIADSSASLSPNQAKSMSSVLVELLEADSRQHRDTPGFVATFVVNRPTGECADYLRKIAPTILGGRYRSNANPFERTSDAVFVRRCVGHLPSEDANELVVELAKRYEEHPRDDIMDEYLVAQVAGRVATKDHPRMAAQLLPRLEATKVPMAILMYSQCLGAMSEGLSTDDISNAVNLVAQKINALVQNEDENGWIISNVCNELTTLIRKADPRDVSTVVGQVAEAMNVATSGVALDKRSGVYRGKCFPDLVALLTVRRTKPSPDAMYKIVKASVLHFVFGHPSSFAKTRTAHSTLDGKLAPGRGLELWKQLTANMSVSQRSNQFGALVAIAGYMHNDDVDPCFQIALKLVESHASPSPNETAVFYNQQFLRGLAILADRHSAKQAPDGFDRVWKVTEIKNDYMQRLKPVLLNLLKSVAYASADEFWTRFNKLNLSPKTPDGWRLVEHLLLAANPTATNKTAADIATRTGMVNDQMTLADPIPNFRGWSFDATHAMTSYLLANGKMDEEQRIGLIIKATSATLPIDQLDQTLNDPSAVGVIVQSRSVTISRALRQNNSPTVWEYVKQSP